jgi:hypothetical protein
MGIINFSIPKGLVNELIENASFDNFIETGTFRGETSFWAANYFDKVYTIEISPEISKETSSRSDTPTNIEFLIGNSKDLLKPLVSRIKGRCFFWLDGHWCSGAGGKDEECPLFYELEAISALKDAVIFIDDARCFLGPLPPPHDYKHWPVIDDVIIKLKTCFPESFVTIIDDVIICVPNSLREIIYNYWMNTFDNRYSNQNVQAPKIDTILKTIPKKKILKYLLGW